MFIRTAFTTLLLVITIGLFAQDTLVFKDKQKIVAKLAEVGTDEVKYHKWDNLEGPIFITKKKELIVIKYANGDEDVISQKAYDQMNRPPIPSKSGKTDWYGRDYDANMRKYRSKKIPAMILTSVGGTFVITSAVLFATAAEYQQTVSLPGMVLGGLGIPLVSIGGRLFTRAKLYKKRAEKQKATAMISPAVFTTNEFTGFSVLNTPVFGATITCTF